MKNIFLFTFLLIICIKTTAQGWKLELSSNVELKTWKLTDKSDVKTIPLLGATIKLMKGATQISQTSSDANGDFTVLVPPADDFIVEVSYPGCTTKRFAVTTKNVPDFGEEIFNPTFSIGGFILSKPFQGIDYSGLQKPLVKVVYVPKIKNFDDDEAFTQGSLGVVGKIYDSEDALIENFCSTNKKGNEALKVPDCPLAKSLYEKAKTIIAGEQYPVEQLKKVGACLKEKEDAENKAKAEAAAKIEAERIAKAKIESDKLAKEKEASDKLAKEKEAAAKIEAEKIAKKLEEDKKTETDKLAKDKEAAAKIEAEKIAKEKIEAEKIAKKLEEEKKNETDKLAKDKEAAAKIEAEKIAKKLEGEKKVEADKLAKDKDSAAKIEAEKIAKEKIEAEKIAKKLEGEKKVEADKLAKDKEAAAKIEAEKIAKEKIEADKLTKGKDAAAKIESDKLAKAKEKEEKDRIAKEKIEQDKIAKEKAKKDKEEVVKEPKIEPVKEPVVVTTTTVQATPKETPENKMNIYGTGHTPENGAAEGSKHYNVRTVIGEDKYKTTVKKADEYLKMKRYKEAKDSYSEALGLKPNDKYATAKLAEIEKALLPK